MDIVYALHEGIAYNGPAVVTLHRGTVWDAADPFVSARPDLFSATPPVVHNTTGIAQPDAAPIETASRRPGQKSAAKKQAR